MTDFNGVRDHADDRSEMDGPSPDDIGWSENFLVADPGEDTVRVILERVWVSHADEVDRSLIPDGTTIENSDAGEAAMDPDPQVIRGDEAREPDHLLGDPLSEDDHGPVNHSGDRWAEDSWEPDEGPHGWEPAE